MRGIERIICLGDLVGKGPHSSEAIEIIRKECEVVVMGNWDDFITKLTEFEALKWHQKQLSEEQNDYLRRLPFSIEFYMSGKLIRMFHASPRSLYERIQPHASREERISMFENSELTENIEGKENQMSFATVTFIKRSFKISEGKRYVMLVALETHLKLHKLPI